MTSIIIPAHNEEYAVARLLRQLTAANSDDDTEILVMCNGCTDATAQVARAFGAKVTVIELSEASKASALKAGDDIATEFPRIYIDADVEIDLSSIRALEQTLARPEVHATAPRRLLARQGLSIPARWYYDVWEHLPQVEEGLFARGVIAVSEEGFASVRELPKVMADDLAISESFIPDQRPITPDAVVTIYPARTWRALVRRRVRVTVGNRQLRERGLARPTVETSLKVVLRLAQRDLLTALKLPIFLAAALYVRVAALYRTRKGNADAWTRDDSSRAD